MRPNCVILFAAALCGAASAAAVADGAQTETRHSQPCFVVGAKQVEVAVSGLGGHMTAVFYRDSDRPVEPYYVSPWQSERPSAMPTPVLVPLRGDFFCLPFGENTDAVDAERHPVHGEVAGSPWRLVGAKTSGDVTTLTLAIDTKVRPGRVTKEISLVGEQNVVYSRHTIEGFAGRAPLGHHATMRMPETEGAVRIATSPIRFGMTYPRLISDPRQREYQSLLPGAKWTDLAKVPAAWKGAPDADLTRMPARYGHTDLVQLINESWEKTRGPAWTTATYPKDGYLWFSLKDPAVLTTTVFWIENHGRHGHPWNGRNNCLGLEDVTAYFADGLAASTRENILTKEGVTTAVELHAERPTVVNYIQGVVKIPAGFECVRTLEFAPGMVTFISTSGQRASAGVRHEFLKTGKL